MKRRKAQGERLKAKGKGLKVLRGAATDNGQQTTDRV